MTNLTITNEDCMELMRRTPDGYYDLAVVDPPYRDTNQPTKTMRALGGKMQEFGQAPKKPFFDELRRVSKNQIVWGGNNFFDILGNTNCFIFWDKMQPCPNYADGELAWTSFSYPAARIRLSNTVGFIAKGSNAKIHPTQKPVALYRWLLTNYAKPGQRILDTHMGSGSIAIACYDLGFDLTACELDPDYYAAAMKRIQTHIQTHPFGEDLQPKAANLNGMETLTLFA